jgi:hypothetical protein
MPAGVPVQVRLADDEISALDNYRREKLNPPSRGRALRELARKALREHNFSSPTPVCVSTAFDYSNPWDRR